LFHPFRHRGGISNRTHRLSRPQAPPRVRKRPGAPPCPARGFLMDSHDARPALAPLAWNADTAHTSIIMRILISGGAGFIGSHLVERLVADGHRVRVLDNLSSGRRANLPHHRQLEFIEGDVREAADAACAAHGVDAIYHLAAVASVQASVDAPAATHATNFLGTLNLLEAARREGVGRFVYASSAAVYGDAELLPVSEESRPRPLSPYAADKLGGEHYLRFYGQRYGLAATAFRFFNVYGPRQDPTSPYSGVISVFAERIRAGAAVTVFGDGRQTRDFVYVSDVVEVLAASLANARTYGTVLNIGRGV